VLCAQLCEYSAGPAGREREGEGERFFVPAADDEDGDDDDGDDDGAAPDVAPKWRSWRAEKKSESAGE
jgi:hypothetical protein